jgi:hypothetical protein
LKGYLIYNKFSKPYKKGPGEKDLVDFRKKNGIAIKKIKKSTCEKNYVYAIIHYQFRDVSFMRVKFDGQISKHL